MSRNQAHPAAKFLSICLFFSFIIFPGGLELSADSSLPDSMERTDTLLTLKDFISLALAHSPGMKQIELDLMIAHQQHRQSMASRLPSLSLNLTTPSFNSSTDRIQRFTGEGYQEWKRQSGRLGSTFSLTQPLPTGGSVAVSSNVSKMQIEENITGYESSVSQNFSSDLILDFSQPLFGVNNYRNELYHASASAKLAELDFENSINELVYTLASEYLTYIKNIHRLEYLETSIRRTAELLEKNEQQFNSGVIPEIEFIQAKIDYANVLVSRLEAEEDASESKRSLLRKLDAASGEETEYSFKDSCPKESPAFSLEQYRSFAFERRADLATLRINGETALYDIGILKKERGISTSMEASVGWKGSGEFIREGMDNFSFNLWSVNLVFNLPLWDGGLSRAKLREAEYQANSASISLEEKEHDILDEVNQAYFIMENARKKLEILEKTLFMVEKNNEIARKMFEDGVNSLDKLMEAELNLHNAEVNVSDALADFNIAVFDLRKAAGLEILPDHEIQN